MKMLIVVLAAFSQVAIAAGAVAPAKKYEVQLDKNDGAVEFQATGKPSLMKIVGKGQAPTGNFVLSDSSATGQFSFSLDSLKTGIALRDNHMKEKYLQVKEFPQADLKLTEIKLPKPIDGTDVKFTAVPFQGVLKLHGVEKPVSGVADFTVAQSKVNGTANFEIKLSDFGINTPSFAGITVTENVKLSVTGAGTLAPKQQ